MKPQSKPYVDPRAIYIVKPEHVDSFVEGCKNMGADIVASYKHSTFMPSHPMIITVYLPGENNAERRQQLRDLSIAAKCPRHT